MRLRIAKALPIFVPAVMLPGMAAFPCPGSRRISRLLCSSGFRFQYPRHLVGGGAGGVFLEKAGHDKNGIPHADFRHAVAAAGGTAQRFGTATTSTAGLSGSAIPSSKTRPAARRRT